MALKRSLTVPPATERKAEPVRPQRKRKIMKTATLSVRGLADVIVAERWLAHSLVGESHGELEEPKESECDDVDGLTTVQLAGRTEQ